MSSTFTRSTLIEKPGAGTQNNTWGATLNRNFDDIDMALTGGIQIAIAGNYTLATVSGGVSEGRNHHIVFSGSLAGPATITVTPNTAQKLYVIRNAATQNIVISQGSGATVTIPPGRTAVCYCDGAGATAAVTNAAASLFQDSAFLAPLAAAPSPAMDGVVYHDSALGRLRVHQGGAWRTLLQPVLTEALNCNSHAVLNAGSVEILRAAAGVSLNSRLTPGAVDEKIWDWQHTAVTFALRAVNDAYSASAIALIAGRSGANVTYLAAGHNPAITNATFGVHNAIASGVTRFSVRAGAGQGTAALAAIENASAAVLAEIAPLGASGAQVSVRDTAANITLRMASSAVGMVGTETAHALELRTGAVARVTLGAGGNATFATPAVLTPAALPGSPVAGMLAIDSADANRLKWWNGSAWQTAAAVGGLGDPGANGLVVRTALNTTTARALTGTAGKIVVSNGDGVAANPVVGAGADLVDRTAAGSYTAGARQIFTPSAGVGALAIAAAALPSTPVTGDLAIDSGDANRLKWWNGTAWQLAGGGGTPGGSSGQVQFNNAGVFGGSANLFWDNAASRLSVTGAVWHSAELHTAVRTGAITAVAGDTIPTGTGAGAFTVTLPASPAAGWRVTVYDYAGTWHTNNLTVGRNAQNIMGVAQDLRCDVRFARVTLVFVDATRGWVIV